MTVDGTDRSDQIAVTGADGSASVTGLPATVNIANAEPANDTLTVNALGGNDNVDASALAATVFEQLTVDGGDRNDTIAGSQGADVLLGGAGNDSVDGNQGSDVALLGDGNDTFVWDPGDGSDTVEGQDGTDTMVFNGSNANENIDLSANGSRLRLFRDVGNIVMDTNGVEHVAVNTLGGADTVVTNDLTGTGVTAANVDLGSNGAGDGQADHVVVNGTTGPDAITVAGSNGSATVDRARRDGEHRPRRARERHAHDQRTGGHRHGRRLSPGRVVGQARDQRRRRCRPADRLGWQRPRRRRQRKRRRPARVGRRHLRLEPGRRQRHGRRPGWQRHDALQRRQRRREHRPFRERHPAPVLPRRRQHHHGHERC